MRRLIMFVVLLSAASGCGLVYGQELSKAKVIWGINGIKDSPEGALILDVAFDGAAAKAGLSAGDVVTAIDGSPIKNSKDLKEKIKASQPYTLVDVKFQRFGKVLEKTVLPRGFLRLEVKDFDRSFVIPGMSQTAAKQRSAALDALDNINVLKQVIIDPKSGQIALVGTYDPKYATGPIPYLDLLKTAIKYPEPKFSLIPVYDKIKSDDEVPNPYGIPIVPALLGMPAAERERQLFIRAISDAYGITQEEYVKLYNYAYMDYDGNIAPPEIGRIIVKMCRHLGWDDVAEAYGQLEGNTADGFTQAMKTLGQEKEAQNVMADKGIDEKQKEKELLNLACVAIIEKLEVPPGEAKQLRYSLQNNWKPEPAELLKKKYQLIPISIKDKTGRPITGLCIVKVPIGDAATRIICGTGNDTLLVKIVAEDVETNTNLVRIMYEADYAGKTFVIRPDLFEKIPGQMTIPEYTSRKIEEMGGNQKGIFLDAKFWFEPKHVAMKVSPDKKVVSFGAAEIRFTTSWDKFDAGGFKSKEEAERMMKKISTIYDDWCAQYTDKYDLYAQIFPPFHALRESAKMVALAKWLNSEKISVNLGDVKPEHWNPPEKIIGFWRSGVLAYKNSETGKYSTAPYHGVTGGVTFKPKNAQWTAVESTTVSETGLSEQLKLSSQLGEKAVDAARSGDIENARYLSELSAQAMTGEVLRGDLIKLNVPLAEPVQLPASPQAVLLQKEMIKQTYDEINELSQNPASKAKAAEKLGQIGNIYNNMRSNPASASNYLYKLQAGKVSEVSGPKVEPVPSVELLKDFYDTIHKRTAGTNELAQEILRSLKTNKPPMPENINKYIDDLVPGDVILIASVPFADREKAGMKDVLISNAIKLLDRWSTNCWSSPASHVALYLGERNGKRWYEDNTSEHGPVIKEEQEFLKEYGARKMDVATLVGEPISPAEAEAIFKAVHELRDAGITYGVGSDKRMVCSEAARWLLMKAGRDIPRTESGPGYPNLITAFIQKKDLVTYSPADYYDNQGYFLIRPLDIQRK